MKIKLHWGIAIAVFYSIFVLFLVGNVIFSATQRNDLVDNNYYGKELKYQDQIDKSARTKKLPQQLKVVKNPNKLSLLFPDIFNGKNITGNVEMYRPSNASLDRKIALNINSNNSQIIDLNLISKGYWKLKINWFVNDSAYYSEESVTID
jgi:hypothetical protein